jgi:hypothetical protein
MKLGTETGSMTNHLYSRAVIGQPTPEVGMGATVLCWTDRHAATIVVVYRDGEIITVQEDHAKFTGPPGMSENQTYSYSPNKNGSTYSFRKDKNGTWSQVSLNPDTARWNKVKGPGLRIGEREEYRDPCF